MPARRAIGRLLRPVLAAAVPAIITIGIATAAIAWRDAPWLRSLEGRLLETLYDIRGPVPTQSDTLIIAIDDRTVAHYGGWPLPRTVLAELVTALDRVGASAIGLDLLLIDPQVDDLGKPAPGDRALISAVRAGDRVVLAFAVTDVAGETDDTSIADSGYLSYVQAADAPRPALPQAPGLLVPFDGLAEVASVGHVSVHLEPDGAVRQWSPVVAMGDRRYPAMAVELVRHYLGIARSDMLWIEGEGLQLGDRFVPTDAIGRLSLNHYGPEGSFETVSLADLLTGRVPELVARNRIVLVGATATGVGGTNLTPFDPQLPGVELVAAMTHNLLRGETLQRGPVSAGLSFALLIGCAVLMALLMAIRSPGALLIGLAGVVALWGLTLFTAFATFQVWVDGVPAAAGMLAIALWVLVRRVAADRRSERAAEARSRALARFVAPSLAERLARRDHALTDIHERDAAVVFVDLVGFTQATESMPAVATLPLLSRFYRLVESATDAHRGIVDKFIGDGAMLLFGVGDRDGPSAAGDAVSCALQLVDAFEAQRGEWPELGRPLSMSIGVHFGPVAMAEIGGERQVQFTATGDTVNVAARLEELTRELHTSLIVSGDAMAAARAALPRSAVERFAALPPRVLRGRSRPLSAWMLGDTPQQAVA